MLPPPIWLRLSLLLVSLALAESASAASRWHTVDEAELERIRVEVPRAAELFELAEAKLRAGELTAAERALADAGALAPTSWLVQRRHCQVLSELGKRAEAVELCSLALARSTAMDSRAMVGALMATPQLSTPREVIQAVREGVAAARLRDQPFSDAALCDIAYHIGDDAMLNTCVENLQRIAPDNFETLRWQAVRKQAPAWALWLGWLALSFSVLGTVLHAALRWLRRPAKGANPAAVAGAFALAWATVAGGAHAQAPDPAGTPAPEAGIVSKGRWQLSQFPVNHDDPESAIPTIEQRNKDPLNFGYFLQDLNTEALKAERLGDFRTALKYWRAAAKAVPDAAVGFGKTCRAYQMLGEREPAIEYCSRALNLEGASLEDYMRYAELVTQKPTPLTELEVQDLDAVVSHLKAQPERLGPAAVVECRLGAKLEDAARLQRCTEVLGKLSPGDPRTLTFLWSYALLRKDYGEAKRLVTAMEKASMPQKALDQVRATTAKESAWWRRPFTDWRYGLGLFAGLALAAWGALVLRRRGSRLPAAGGPGPAPAI